MASARARAAVLLLALAATDRAVADGALRAPPPAEPYLRAIAPDLRSRLEREHFVMLPGNAATPGLAQGLVVFSQPPAVVWQLMAQTQRQREYRPELSDLTTVERSTNVAVERHRIRMLFIDLSYYMRYELDPAASHIEWSLDASRPNDFDEISGAWDFYDLGNGRTLGRLGSAVRVGKAVPRSMQDAITRKKVPETLENVRHWVDSAGGQQR